MHASRQQLHTLGRLKNRPDFLKIQQQGRKWVSHGIVVQVLPNALDQIRVGFTVTKKTDASAVKRNRIKRRLRAVAADVLSDNALGGHDYVLIGRTGAATRPYEILKNDLKWCLAKLGCVVETKADAP